MKKLKTKDFIAPFSIGLIIGLIFVGISRYLDLPEIVTSIGLYSPIYLPILCVIGFYIASLIGKIFFPLFQLAKFVLVGALNTFIDLGALNLLMFIFSITSGPMYSVFKGISFSLSVVNSYFWNKFWTFGQRETGVVKGSEFGKFAIIAGTGFFLNVSIASFVVNTVGPQFGISDEMWANAGAFVAILCVFMWNFLGYKLIVFKK